MTLLRTYGTPPYSIVLLHGGPGAVGYMVPVAQELSSKWGIFEPLLTKKTLADQLTDLKDQILKTCQPPVILMGHSWGAIVAYLFTAEHPDLVKKVILVSSALFNNDCLDEMMQLRFSRMSQEDQQKVSSLTEKLSSNPSLTQGEKNAIFTEFGRIFTIVDSYDLIPAHFEEHFNYIEANYDIYKAIFPETVKLRSQDVFLELGKKIDCPVVGIHGDYDPHPVQGIKDPLSKILKDFRFILLENCGHLPWCEKQARSKFFEILFQECQP